MRSKLGKKDWNYKNFSCILFCNLTCELVGESIKNAGLFIGSELISSFAEKNLERKDDYGFECLFFFSWQKMLLKFWVFFLISNYYFLLLFWYGNIKNKNLKIKKIILIYFQKKFKNNYYHNHLY